MKTRLLFGAVVASATLVSPANASSPPDSHDLPVGGCGFMVVHRPYVGTEPPEPWDWTRYEGEADCEVMFLNRNDPTVRPTTWYATVTVSLQREANHDGGGVLAACTFTPAVVGWVVVGACEISITVEPGQPLYMCVQYTWTESSLETGTRHFSYTEDFDPVTPTKQCVLAISA